MIDNLFTLAQVQTAIVSSIPPPSATQIGIPAFATPSDAQSGTIPDTYNFVQVLGAKVPGDGGAATYKRVSSLPSSYVGDGSTTPFVPPSFTSGGVPVLCFTTTTTNQAQIGPTSASIIAGCLAFLVVFVSQDTGSGLTIIDSAGNVYVPAVSAPPGFSVAAIYYCANPVFAPIGTTFSGFVGGSPRAVSVYSVPGFTGAVLDQTGSLPGGTEPSTGAMITTGPLTALSEFAIGAVFAGGSPIFTEPGPTYTLPAGWTDVTPPTFGNNPVACFVSSSTSPITFNPTWPSHPTPPFNAGAIGVVATFKTFPKPVLDASFWSLLPSVPLHTAAFGVDPTAPDNVQPFRSFGHYLALIASASGGMFQARAGTPATGTVTISIANPAVITVALDPRLSSHNLHGGSMISFSTTGNLPTGIVAGQIYYVQYGTVTPTSFQISASPLFDPIVGVSGGSATVPKGTPVATSGTQAGTHSYTTYGQSWTDFILDPGVYYASHNQVPGIGTGIQKWRLLGYGARLATNANFFASCANDVNAATGGSTFAYTAQFNTTVEVHSSGNFNNSVILNTPSQAVNFYVNSWVALMCIEQQASADGNWNPAIFEYAKVQSIDAGTGIITFWDRLQYNYRSTYPKFISPSNAATGGVTGSATIVQLSDVFDQEIEVHGLNMFGVTEQTIGGCLSVRFVDCDFWGWAFDSGPSPVFVRRYIVENCRFHNCVPEIDKMIDYVLYRDCDFDLTSYPRFQSASINKAVFDRCKLMGGFSGTPKDLVIRDSFIAGTFTIGPVYGSTQRMTLINSYIQRLINNDQASETLLLQSVTFSNGTIKIASGVTTTYGLWNPTSTANVCPAPWAQPGAKVCIDISASVSNSGQLNSQSTCGMMTCFTVLDVYVDGSNAFSIDTDITALPNTAVTVTGSVAGNVLTVTAISPVAAQLLIGTVITGTGLPANTIITADLGLPNVSNLGNYTISSSATLTSRNFTATLPMNFLPHPCPRLTTINCTGGRWMADQAGAPADIPVFSYFKRAYAGLQLSTNFHDRDLLLAGNLLNWTINVIKPYTGGAATYVCLVNVIGFATSGGITYPTFLQQTINLKTPGIRTITAAGVTGAVAGDTIVAIPFWLSGSHTVTIGTAPLFGLFPGDVLSQMPYFTMTAQTDQGIGFSGITVNTFTSGVDTFADTITQVASP